MLRRKNIKEETVLVIGAGYVGIPLALLCANKRKKVYLYDKNPLRRDKLREGETGINKEFDKELINLILKDKIVIIDEDFMSNKFKEIKLSKIIICVPTPLDSNRLPDLSMVVDATENAVKVSSPDSLVVLESSTYPGTTRELILPLLKKKHSSLGEGEILLSYSPERVDPGNSKWNSSNTPRIVSGLNDKSLTAVSNFYGSLGIPVIPVEALEIAEAAKLFENSFRLVNIAFVNEFAETMRNLGYDPQSVLSAAYTKPFGIMKFSTSAGVGGHCIPIDPYYLTWWGKKNGENLKILEAAQNSNEFMPTMVVNRIKRELGISLRDLRVVVAGITYKPNVADARETPALGIWQELEREGALICWWDPLLDSWGERTRFNPKNFEVDLVLIVTKVALPVELEKAKRKIDLNS